MIKGQFLSVLFTIIISSFSFSAEITPEQVFQDISVCNDELSAISSKLEHFSFIIGIFDSITCKNVRDTLVVKQRKNEELFLNKLASLNEEGLSLQRMANSQDSNYCTPCFKSAVGRFCMEVLNLRSEISQNLVIAENEISGRSALICSSFIDYLRKTVNSRHIVLKLETAGKLVSTHNHKEAMKLVIESIREIYEEKK